MKIIYESVVGSKMHGLDTPNSDTDTRYIYISSLQDMISPFKDKEKVAVQRSELTGDTESFELAKFAKMLSSGNPTCYEVIKSPIYKQMEWSEQLRASIPLFYCSLDILNAHIGYAEAQLKRYLRPYIKLEDPFNFGKSVRWSVLEEERKTTKANFLRRLPKAVVAAHRVLAQGLQLLYHHDFEPVIRDFSSNLATELMQIKSMSIEDINFDWVAEHNDRIENKISSLNCFFDMLPESERLLQPDIPAIEELLLKIYTQKEEQ